VATPPASSGDRILRQPLQERSQRTLERFLDATERLLATRRFEEISVEEIVRAARSSVGAFYARFLDKQALLPCLYARYDEELGARMAELERQRPAGQDLERTAAWIAQAYLGLYRKRTNLMRALALYARTHEAEIGPEMRARRRAQHRFLLETLLAHRRRITHPDPERAVELALHFAVTALRDRVLFAASPHAASLRVSDGELVRECARMLVGYLTLPA
jgi:AcrR family transcriptional regulator